MFALLFHLKRGTQGTIRYARCDILSQQSEHRDLEQFVTHELRWCRDTSIYKEVPTRWPEDKFAQVDQEGKRHDRQQPQPHDHRTSRSITSHPRHLGHDRGA